MEEGLWEWVKNVKGLRSKNCLGGCGLVGCSVSITEGLQVSQSGHLPRLWVQSLVWSHMIPGLSIYRRQPMMVLSCINASFSPFLYAFLSKRNEKKCPQVSIKNEVKISSYRIFMGMYIQHRENDQYYCNNYI